MSNKYTNSQFQKDLQKLESLVNEDKDKDKYKDKDNQFGGNNSDDSNKRFFKIVELDGQIVDFGRIEILKITKGGLRGPGPLAAAKKAIRSISEHLGMSGNKKLKINVQFMIKETTRDSSKKIYGPYKGYYHEYTAEEKKKATIKNKKSGKILSTFHMKPIVKLINVNNYKKKYSTNNATNKKNNSQKGG